MVITFGEGTIPRSFTDEESTEVARIVRLFPEAKVEAIALQYTVEERVEHAVRYLGPRRYQITDLAPAATRELGEIGSRAAKALPGLEKLLKDQNPQAREEAGKAIAKIQHSSTAEESD